MDEMIKSYELVSENRVKTKNRPQNMINKFYNNVKIPFDDIFGEESVLFNIRLTPKTKNPLNPNWYDLIIEPFFSSPRYYLVRFVYRNKDIKKFKSMAKGIKKIIINSLNILEEN